MKIKIFMVDVVLIFISLERSKESDLGKFGRVDLG